MRVAVLGSGVIGVTSAWRLARAGHAVTVIDRREGPALETSFANAGEISPGFAAPWAAPSVPRHALRWMMMRHAPFILRPRLDPAMLAWLLAALGNCTPAAFARNRARMARLAAYSQGRLAALRQETGIAYDAGDRGMLQLFRSRSDLEEAEADARTLQGEGVACEILDRAGCIRAEPGLAHAAAPFAGGIRASGDETGDCYKFTSALAALAAREGVVFRFGEGVQGLRLAGGRIEAAVTARDEVVADVFVAALGSYTPRLVAPLGLRLPVYPVKGYSLTARILDAERAPVSTVVDEAFKVASTRLGDRIRVAGMAEISGFSSDLPARRRESLVRSAADLFPGAGDWEGGQFWSGLRPMTPDGAPVVGPTAIPNLYLNTGHGTLGWTMACGSAQVISDQISGRKPEIETGDLAIARYSRH